METQGIRRDEIIGLLHEMLNKVEQICQKAAPAELLNQQEDAAERWVRKIGQLTIQRGFELYRQQRPEPRQFACPCGGQATHKGRWDTTVSTVLGEVALHGLAYACRSCKQTASPGLEQLWLNGRTFTPRLQEAMALLDASLSQRQAASLLTRLLRVRVSAGTLSDVAVSWGQAWGGLREQGAVAALRRFDSKPAEPMYASTDGMRVCTPTGWRELKVAAFYNSDKTHKRVCASFSRSDEFSHQLGHYADWVGALDAAEVRCIGDGAEWVWNVLDTNFPEASERIIDIFHVHEHLWDYAKIAYGEGAAQAKRWASEKCHRLKHEGPWLVQRSLVRQRPSSLEAQEALRQLKGYMSTHADRMDYPRLQAAGVDVGSGPMENACKQLGVRLKGADKRWRLERAEAIAVLRCIYLSDEWDAFPALVMLNRTGAQRAALLPLIHRYNEAFMMN